MIVKKKKLEILLSKIKSNPTPKAYMEQYTIPCEVASTILHMAAYTFNDIIKRTVCDLGCGSGRLAIGAAYLGAEEVIGVDLDEKSIMTAKLNAQMANVKVDWVIGDIDIITGNVDTVLENPPFGVKKHGADLKFIRKALSIGKVIYSIHKSGERNRKFISEFVEKNGGKITSIIGTNISIPYTFKFHKKPKYNVKADIYRIAKGNL
jgi:putative methylase